MGRDADLYFSEVAQRRALWMVSHNADTLHGVEFCTRIFNDNPAPL